MKKILNWFSEHVPWGQKKGKFPTVIKPGESKTFSVYSAAGLAWGLEFYITMQIKPNKDKPEENMYGGFDFFVDMPYYRGVNRSKFSTYGIVKQMGFVEIPEKQHDFSTTVRVYELKESDVTVDAEKVDDYFKSLYDWKSMEKIPDNDEDAPINDFIPKQNCTANRMIVGRSKEFYIPKKMWHFIKDKIYTDDFSKQYFINNYFTVAAYEIRKRKTNVEIHSKQSLSKTVEISHNSEIRRETNEQFLLENTLEAGVKSEGASLVDTLKIQYSITNIKEYCESSALIEKQEIHYEPDDRDRLAVWWDVVKVVALYRKRRNCICELVGLDDYYLFTVPKTYYCDTETEV